MRIYLRRLDQWQARPIPGTEDAGQPLFSPDGNWLGFVTVQGELKKVNLAGGEPVELCESGGGYGATWGPDDTIIFAGIGGGLFRVAASGGEPEQITRLDEEAAEISHRLPHILPNGKAVLFTALRHKNVGLDWKRVQIFAQSLETSERKLLIQEGSDARYVPSGHLVFAREGRLLAVPFDPVRLEVNGPEVPVLDGINHSIYTRNSLWETGVAQFSFSLTGMLAYVPGSVFPEIKSTPVWVDRQGREEPWAWDPRGTMALGVFPLMAGRSCSTTATLQGMSGSNDSGPWQIYARPYPGPGPAVQISTQGGTRPAWSRDGQEIFFRQGGKCYSVGIETDGEHLIPGLPVELFEDRRYRVSTPIRSYDVAPDGRFLHMKVPDEAAMTAITEEFFPTRIRLIQNWFEELKRLVPTDH